MSNVLRIEPELCFPIGTVFEIPDQFNGHQRGTFYFRSIYNWKLRGPFMTAEQASYHLIRDDGA